MMRAALVVALLLCMNAASSMPLTLFNASTVAATGARCLDGSPAGFYADFNSSSTDWVFFLQGGGLCVTKWDCQHRTTTSLGSSKYWASDYTDSSNLMSTGTFNPFRHFNRVYLPYCSGDTWVGNPSVNETDPLMGGLYTAGHVIFRTVLDQLRANHGLGHATSALLSGASAGGIGTFQNADFLSEYLPNAKVAAAPQAGFYIPTGARLYPEFILDINVPVDKFMSFWVGGEFSEPFLDQSCVADMKAQGKSPKLCWDVTVHYPYIKTPLFIAECASDQNQINFLMLAPDNPKNQTALDDFKAFYGRVMRKSVTEQISAPSKAKDGLFLPSCFSHTGALCMDGGPVVQNQTFGTALASWWAHGTVPRLVDDCPQAAQGVPCNARCTCP